MKNYRFHCDEVLACYLLLNHTKAYRGATILRTRDPSLYSKADILVDVGATFHEKEKRFDHHQRAFEHTFSPNFHTKLSSAGLVYKYFGKEIIREALGKMPRKKGSEEKEKEKEKELDATQIATIHNRVYEVFIEGIDGIDNGIRQYNTEDKPNYRESTNLSSRVNRLNPMWNDEQNDEIAMEQFKKAMVIAGDDFMDFIRVSFYPLSH